MARSISVVRRKPDLVDLTVRKRDGITGFRFSAATNFDTAFTAFATVPNYGLVSRSVPQTAVVSAGSQFRDHARFVFDPADYVATASALVDTDPFFLRIESRNPDGSFNAAEAMHLILPATPGPAPNRAFHLRGTVPSAASLAAALEIQLPMQCTDFEIQNDGAAIMFLAFAPTGAEYQLSPVSSIFRAFDQVRTAVSQVFMRGSGGTTTISSIWTLRNNEAL